MKSTHLRIAIVPNRPPPLFSLRKILLSQQHVSMYKYTYVRVRVWGCKISQRNIEELKYKKSSHAI